MVCYIMMKITELEQGGVNVELKCRDDDRFNIWCEELKCIPRSEEKSLKTVL